MDDLNVIFQSPQATEVIKITTPLYIHPKSLLGYSSVELETLFTPTPSIHPCIVKTFGDGTVILSAPDGGRISRISLGKDDILHVDAQNAIAWDPSLEVSDVYEEKMSPVRSALSKTAHISKNVWSGLTNITKKTIKKLSAPPKETTEPVTVSSPGIQANEVARAAISRLKDGYQLLRELISTILGRRVLSFP